MNFPTQSPSRYLRQWALTVVLLLFGTVALILLVDPYGLYGWVRKAGFNAVKPGLTRYHDEIKMTHAGRAQADVLILGNSRAEIGFDPQSDVFKHAAAKVYNLAIPGTGIETARGQLDHLLGSGARPSTVLLGLDFLDFVQISAPAPVHQSRGPHAVQNIFWRFDSLLSLSSLKDSLRTLGIQNDSEAQSLRNDGFNPLLEYQKLARTEGYFALFKQKEGQYAKTMLGKARGDLSAASFAQLDSILNRAAESGVTVKLAIYPYHAQILVLLEGAGLWPKFEAWKERLAAHIALVHERYPKAAISLFDFSGFGAYQCEAIPAKSERQARTQWYWEGGHFKKSLGDLVLQRMFAPAELAADADFGFILNASSLAGNTERLRAERADCVQRQAPLFDSAKLALEQARTH